MSSSPKPHVPRIVVLDEDGDMRRLLEPPFRLFGFASVYADRATDVAAAAMREPMDAFVLDVDADDRGAGFETLLWIRRYVSYMETPVAAVAGSTPLTDAERAMLHSLRASIYFKGGSFLPLMAHLEKQFRGKSGSRRPR